MPAARQLPGRHRRNVGVKIGGIERQHVGGKIEPSHRRLRNCDLRLLQLLIGDMLGHPMIGLARECRRRQTGQAGYGSIEKLRQIPLGSGRAGPLDGHRNSQFADRGAAFGAKVTARPVDVAYQIELLGNPDQCADIPNRLRSYRSGGTQIRDGSSCGGAQNSLACNGTASHRIPHRLGGDTVAAAIHFSYEYMHIFHVAQSPTERKRYTTIIEREPVRCLFLTLKNAKVGLEVNVRRESRELRSHENRPPNYPPREVFLVLKLKFYTKIFAL